MDAVLDLFCVSNYIKWCLFFVGSIYIDNILSYQNIFAPDNLSHELHLWILKSIPSAKVFIDMKIN